jgi:uncharacterized protein (TIGR02266 family)
LEEALEPDVERRSGQRLRAAVEVTLDSESQLWTGLTSDVSRGGVFIATWRAIPVGTELLIELALPDATVRAAGRVRWRRDACEGGPAPGIGIAFEHIDGGGLELLERFCASRAPLYHDDEDASANAGC